MSRTLRAAMLLTSLAAAFTAITINPTPAAAVVDTPPPADASNNYGVSYGNCLTPEQVLMWESAGYIVATSEDPVTCSEEKASYDLYYPLYAADEEDCGDGRTASANDAIAYSNKAGLTDPDRANFLYYPCKGFEISIRGTGITEQAAKNTALQGGTRFQDYMASGEPSLPTGCLHQPSTWNIEQASGTSYHATVTFSCQITG